MFGEFPFEMESIENPLLIYQCIINNDLTFPENNFDEKLIDLISGLLEKNPNFRQTKVLNHRYFDDFEIEKCNEMKLKAPFYPKSKINIKLKSVLYEDYLNEYYSNNENDCQYQCQDEYNNLDDSDLFDNF